MIRAIRYVFETIVSLLVVAIGSPLLAIFGRNHQHRPGELVVDDGDLRVDVDERRSP